MSSVEQNLPEKLGHTAGRLSRPIYTHTKRVLFAILNPVYRRAAATAHNAPYHVKYNVAVLTAKAFAIGLWGFHIFGLAWLLSLFFGGNFLVIAACYAPIRIWLNKFATEDDRLPSLWRVLRFRFIRKH